MSDDPTTSPAVPACAGCDPAGGFCHVFGKWTPPGHFELCRTREDLRAFWAARARGEAPCAPPASAPPAGEAAEAKPETLLERLRVRVKPSDPVPDCDCKCAGRCDRFDRTTTEAEFRRCRTSPEERWKLAGEHGPQPKVAAPIVSAPCVHRGKLLRTVRCRLCGKKDRFVEIFACNNPKVAAKECGLERYQVGHDPNFECCNGCDAREEGSLGIDYRDPAQTFRDEFYRYADAIPDPPTWTEGRAVVVCGGWGRFFPSLYVTLSMIRRTGYAGPLQVWGLGSKGELDPRAGALCAHLGVDWFDGERIAGDPAWSMKRCNGWELKALALAACEYREVALFDADSYPLEDPATLFDVPAIAAAGAYFTQDAFSAASKLETKHYAGFGLAHDNRPAWESGQLLVDKGRHWRPVRLALWLNSESERSYRIIYGDKDTFHFAWQKTQSRVCVSSRPDWRRIAFVHKLPSGEPFTVHRCQGKFAIAPEASRPWGPGDWGQRFMSPQKGMRCDELPLEAVAWSFYEECAAKLASLEKVAA